MIKVAGTITRLVRIMILSGGLLFVQACSPAFNQAGFDNVVTLQPRVSALMGKAVNPYAQHTAEVDQLLADVLKAQDHAASINKNENIAGAWNALNNEVIRPFFSKWQRDGALNPLFINESIKISDNSFEAMRKAEEAKKR
ncbi:MAG: hypothetical protein ACOYNO_10570 [Saprospiraceae bacterium]